MPLEPEQLRSWLAAAGKQDAAAFRALYEAAAPKLLGFAMRILRKRELAEEALQEGLVSIWHAAPDYQPGLAAPMTCKKEPFIPVGRPDDFDVTFIGRKRTVLHRIRR